MVVVLENFVCSIPLSPLDFDTRKLRLLNPFVTDYILTLPFNTRTRRVLFLASAIQKMGQLLDRMYQCHIKFGSPLSFGHTRQIQFLNETHILAPINGTRIP